MRWVPWPPGRWVRSTWRIEVLRRQQLLVVVGIRHGRERVVVVRVDAQIRKTAASATEQ
jgi:hypothetical protein